MKQLFTAKAGFWLIFFAVAAIQLLYAPTYPLQMDQAQVFYLARDFWLTGQLPEHGIVNSVRAFNPPFMVWMYLGAIRLPDVGLALVLPGLAVHLVALLLLYRLAARRLGVGIGLFASVLYGFLPCGFYLGHTSWAQGLIPGFYMMMVYAMAAWALDRREWPLAVLPPLVSWITGLHWGGILTIGVIGIIGWRFRAPLRIRPLVLGSLLAVTLWVPFLQFESGRGFADIKVLWKGPLPIVAAEKISPICRELSGLTGEEEHASESVLAVDDIPVSGNGLKQRLSERWPGLFFGARRAYWKICRTGIWARAKAVAFAGGMTHGLASNFMMPPLKTVPETGPQGFMFLAGTTLFLAGLGFACRAIWLRGTAATPAERLLIAAVVLPAVLQNLSAYSSADRPDVAWMFFGPQILFAGLALSAAARVNSLARGCTILLVAAMIMISAADAWPQYKYTISWLRGGRHPQREMAAWIADEVRQSGRSETTVRYDTLREEPTWSWIVSFSAIMDSYRIGADHDFVLLHWHGVRNLSRAPDGWAENPEYIVVSPEGLKRYDISGGAYVHRDFGKYHVLKPKGR